MSPADPVAVSSIEEGGIEFSTRDELLFKPQKKDFLSAGNRCGYFKQKRN